MATHSSVLAWRIPETGEPGGLPCMGSHRVGHDWSDLAAATVRDFPGGSDGEASYRLRMRETWVQSLGQEDLLEKEMATHSSILAWRIPWTVEPGRLQSVGSQSQTRLSNFSFFSFTETKWPNLEQILELRKKRAQLLSNIADNFWK